MEHFLTKFIQENKLENKKILVGLSGGADSAVLCHILSKLNLDLTAIHLNHNWRGEESKRDENFAKNFAKARGIKFYTETLDNSVKKSETNAREARYDFFKRCKENFGAAAVFLAHNKNDNVETLIYRLIKGTGTSGLNSIPIIRDFYYRPLLNFTREDIENYAKNNGVDFILDSSNKNTKYKRNLIREKILPLMKEINPEVINSISTLIEINKMNQKIIEKALFGKTLKSREEFLSYNRELQFELVNRTLKGILKTRDFKTIKRIVEFIEQNQSSKISINNELFLKVYEGEIYLTKKPEAKNFDETPLNIGKNYFLDYEIEISETIPPETFSPNTYLNLDFKKPYILRTRRAGDLIQPFGSNSLQKLKTFFIKKKIPEEIRSKIPLIALGGEVLYVSDIIQSEKLRVAKNQKKCYKISIKKVENGT